MCKNAIAKILTEVGLGLGRIDTYGRETVVTWPIEHQEDTKAIKAKLLEAKFGRWNKRIYTWEAREGKYAEIYLT